MVRFGRNQVTAAGGAFLAITLVVLLSAVNSSSNILFIILGVLAGMIAASLALTWLGLRGLAVTRSLPDHVIAGEPAEIEYRIANRKRLWPTFALHITESSLDRPLSPTAFFVHIPARTATQAFARLLAPRRGLLTLSGVELSSSFPLGLQVRYRHLSAPGQIVVYPRVGTLNRKVAVAYREAVEAGTMTSNRRGGHDEFYGLREYRPGDNFRAIHWRSTARTGELMVRELTANAPPQLIVVLNARTWREIGPGQTGREQVERAIELAATIACDGFLENFAVGLSIAGLDTQAPAPLMGRGARAALLRRLAVLDVGRIRPDLPLPFPNRLASRAEWVIVNLRRADPYKDLLAGSAASRATVLALDDPEAAEWIHFLSGADAARLLREPA
ncbi:MAG TPA: DUF58 domain-containing protein [Phycisphaerae bacterium]|nr:DUF58 domain-containing protein [Phycisphaerae bacterium]